VSQSKWSLNKQLAIPILGISIFILSAMTLMTLWKTRNMAEHDAKGKLGSAAKFHAVDVRMKIEHAFSLARTIATQSESDVKKHQQHRDQLIENMGDYLGASPDLLGVWLAYEPNAYDGQDETFKNKARHEKSGRFFPWWARVDTKLDYNPMVNDKIPELGLYYTIPMKKKIETLMEPYIDVIGDKTAMMTSATVPILRNGNPVGVVGVDVGLNEIDEKVQKIKPYNGSIAFLISHQGNQVSGPDGKLSTKKVQLPFAQEEVLAKINRGEEFEAEGVNPADGQKYLMVVRPLHISVTDEPWALAIISPSSQVFAQVDQLVMFQIVVALVGLIALSCTVFFIARRISKLVADRSVRLESSAGSVNQSIEQLSIAGQSLSESSSSSAAALEETVASLEEMTAMVKLNSDNARQAAALSQTSTAAAVQGEKEMQELVNSMHDISKASKKIEEIINVIDDIAFQTNLLALNASVEAARAGEQGKGFAVVAEAVRSLALRSASAAKDISVLIKDSVEMIGNGTELADKSGEVLKNIVTTVKKVSDLNNEISTASEEQATGIHQISKAMTDLDQSVQSNAASSEEIASTAEEIRNQSRLMNDVTMDLKVIVQGSNSSSSGGAKAA